MSVAEVILKANAMLQHTNLGLLARSTLDQVFGPKNKTRRGRNAHPHTAKKIKYVVEHWTDGQPRTR